MSTAVPLFKRGEASAGTYGLRLGAAVPVLDGITPTWQQTLAEQKAGTPTLRRDPLPQNWPRFASTVSIWLRLDVHLRRVWRASDTGVSGTLFMHVITG